MVLFLPFIRPIFSFLVKKCIDFPHTEICAFINVCVFEVFLKNKLIMILFMYLTSIYCYLLSITGIALHCTTKAVCLIFCSLYSV